MRLWISLENKATRKATIMGYPTKVQQISRQKGNQWYVNFPNALAEAMSFTKGETVEWEVDSLTALRMIRTEKPRSTRSQKERVPESRAPRKR